MRLVPVSTQKLNVCCQTKLCCSQSSGSLLSADRCLTPCNPAYSDRDLRTILVVLNPGTRGMSSTSPPSRSTNS